MEMNLVRPLLAGLTVAFVIGCDDPTKVGADTPFFLEEAYSFTDLAAGDFVTQFGFDGDGVLWVTTFEGTIFRIDEGETRSFDAASSIGMGRLHDLFIDGSNRAWVTAGESVAVFESGTWIPKGPAVRMGLDPVASQVAVNSADEVLVAMGSADAGGLLLFRDGTWRAITPESSDLPSPLVLEIEVAEDGSFWVASGQYQGRGGLTRIAEGSVSNVLTTGDGLLYNWIDDLAIGDREIYVGYAVPLYDLPGVPDGGLQVLSIEGEVVASWYPFESGLTSNRVRSLTYSSDGELWFATGLDEDQVGCESCFSGVGMVDAGGAFRVLSSLNSDLVPNAYLPHIGEGPNGQIYVVNADRNQILRVVG